MHQLQRSWVRSQHPSAQWNLRGGSWSSAEYCTNKKKKSPQKILQKKRFKIYCKHDQSLFLFFYTKEFGFSVSFPIFLCLICCSNPIYSRRHLSFFKTRTLYLFNILQLRISRISHLNLHQYHSNGYIYFIRYAIRQVLTGYMTNTVYIIL